MQLVFCNIFFIFVTQLSIIKSLIIKYKILPLFILIIYCVTLFSSQFFHSHEEKYNEDASSFALHSHYFYHSGNNNYFSDKEFYLSDNNYFSEDHTYANINIKIFFVSSIIINNQINLNLENNLSHHSLFNKCISLPLRDNCIHSASNTSPPSV